MIVQLNAALKKVGLDWVVQEVSAVVERGIEERKEVALQSFDAADMPTKNRGRKTEVTVTRPFTDLEELQLLVASVRAAVLDANEIQEEALLGLKGEDAASPQISFRPDVPEGFEDKGYSIGGARGHPFDLSLDQVAEQKDRIARVRALIVQLEQLIHAH